MIDKMGRERQPFIRIGYISNVQKLIVIASEGTKTEVQYFEELKSSDLYDNSAIYVEPLRRQSTSSSPRAVLAAIKKFKQTYKIKDSDELWVLIDRDKQSWTIAEIDHVAQQCIQAKIGFAMSNPCFELWLLLHVTGLEGYTVDELKQMFENRKVNEDRTWLDKELSDLLEDGFNKNNIRADRFLKACSDAMVRAEALDTNPQHRWPNELGTRVYRLLRQILRPEV